MTKYYKSQYYKYPIEVDNIQWEIIVTITDNSSRKIIYSWYDIINKNTNSNYITKGVLWWLLNWIPKKVLILWFWWWSYAKYLEDHFKNIRITGVDIDETMFQVAKNELGVKTNDLLLDKNDKLLEELIEKNIKYDLVFIDVYWYEWIIPEEYSKLEKYQNISKLLNKNWIISINFADYSWKNIWKYNKIHHFLKKIFWENYLHINSEKDKKWNIIWIYNISKKYTNEEVSLNYLNLVKNKKVLYDSNMIKNIYIE